MNHDDRIDGRDAGDTSRPPEDSNGNHRNGGNGGHGREARCLMPVLVEERGAEFGLVWVTASRSELVPGALFIARGRHFVVTGRSPSGATYVCRDVTEEVQR